MMACKRKRENRIALLAWASTKDVFQSSSTSGHVARGTKWYFNVTTNEWGDTAGLWGFTGESDMISVAVDQYHRCDVYGRNNPSSLQLCWTLGLGHDNGVWIDSGFRCGSALKTSFDDENWERIIYHKN